MAHPALAWPGSAPLAAPVSIPAAISPGTGPASLPAVGSAAVACAPVERGSAEPDADLYCIPLIPTPDHRGALGAARLMPARSPFGVAVTRDGAQIYDVTVAIAEVPPAAALGAAGYVAWATTPALQPWVRLGTVSPDSPARGRVDFDRFLIFVSAEPALDAAERAGPLVLRGGSPSMRMLPADDPVILMGAAGPEDADHAGHGTGRGTVADSVAAAGAAVRAGHAGHAAAPTAAAPARWIMPPEDTTLFMPPGMMALRPSVTPFLPDTVGAGPISEVRPRETLHLRDGDSIALTASLVRRTVAGRPLIMYGFNGQHPGPLLHVEEGATITVHFHNALDLPSAVHWHGVRLDNRFDGVPDVTQAPVPPGGSFRYVVHFRDAGIYWYHPHVREDIQQDLGLYGNMLVDPALADAYNPVHREEALVLDDLLLAEAGLVQYGREAATDALMGRFGNVMLVNGSPDYHMRVSAGDVVRLFLTNASNTRTFNVSLAGARLKLIGSDIGRFEREEWVESVVLAPAERYIVEAAFDTPGTVALENRVRAIDHMAGAFLPRVDTLMHVHVDTAAARRNAAANTGRDTAAAGRNAAANTEVDTAAAGRNAAPQAPRDPRRGASDTVIRSTFDRLRAHEDVIAEIARYRSHFGRPVDHHLTLAVETLGLPRPIELMMRDDSVYFHPVEWHGTMAMMSWVSTAREVRWIVRDGGGSENMDVAWRFRVGDVVRVRITNDRNTVHAMQHPIHIHGQRFLVISRNGVATDNLVWKDTVLVPTGQTADVLLELSNPGRWMLHCHIAEHMEAGMMMVFEVDG